MPSPFPGMDPYLETRWRDVHARLLPLSNGYRTFDLAKRS